MPYLHAIWWVIDLWLAWLGKYVLYEEHGPLGPRTPRSEIVRGYLRRPGTLTLWTSWKAFLPCDMFNLTNLNSKMIFQECPVRWGFSDFTLYLRINRIIGWRIFGPVVSSSVVLSQHLSAWWSVSVALGLMIRTWSAPIIHRHPIQVESAYYY